MSKAGKAGLDRAFAWCNVSLAYRHAVYSLAGKTIGMDKQSTSPRSSDQLA